MMGYLWPCDKCAATGYIIRVLDINQTQWTRIGFAPGGYYEYRGVKPEIFPCKACGGDGYLVP